MRPFVIARMPDSTTLTINAGSSSLKFGLFTQEGTELVRGGVDDIGASARFHAKDADGRTLDVPGWTSRTPTHEDVVASLLPWVRDHLGARSLGAAGHRVVHGGRHLVRPALVNPALMAEMETLVPLAPLHQPHCLAAIRAVEKAAPGIKQVACFDTAFHRTMPDMARRFALPRPLAEEGVERYGFHGLSYEYIAGRLAELDPALATGRCVVAHLGSGASLCALQAGRSADTTMGFTALDGLPMATRCGALDPGVVLYLLQEKSMSPAAIEDVLYHQSGLLGVSDISGDLSQLLASHDPRARQAVDLLVFRLQREIGALAASLRGLDGVVFTAGIGEHLPELRRRVCAGLAWLGAVLDEAANETNATRIDAPSSRLRLLVVPTNEETVIARHTASLIFGPLQPGSA